MAGWAALALASLQVLAPAALASEAASAASASCPPGATRLRAGSDLATAARAAREGDSFCLGAGTHRMQVIAPKDRQSFHGEPGAVLNGSRLLTGFVRQGRHWFVAGQHQRGHRRPDVPCAAGRPRCGFPEAVFLDERPLLHAASLAEVTPDSFFLDYELGRIYLGTDPAGRKAEASVSPAAFLGGARGVLIAGIVIEKYATSAQAAAVGHDSKPQEWTIRDSEIRLNSAIGLAVGPRSRVLRNRVHNNGNMGAGCGGGDILFEENEISRNGWFRGMDTLWEGGGMKCVGTTRLTLRHNRVEANNGIGMWTDADNLDTLYEGNLFLRNVNSGISHEISYAAVIRGNYFYGNGDGFHVWLWGGAIQLQDSSNVQVLGNLVVAHAGNGITLIQQNRGAGRLGPFVTTGNRVTGNVIIALTAGAGRSGAVADHGHAGMRNGGNVFDGNAYHVPDARAARWVWVEGELDWFEYRARSGQDADSTLSTLGAHSFGDGHARRR